MIRVVIDIEANGLENPTQVWVIVCKNLDTGEYYVFREVTKNAKELERFLEFARMEITWIGHNILGYDLPVLQRLCGLDWDVHLTYDTHVLSKLIDYSREGGHSIEAYGLEFGLEKIDFHDWSKYTVEMEEYCRRDVDICEKIYKKYTRYINLPRHQQAIRLEHSFQLVVNELHTNGFYFNKQEAQGLLENVTGQLSTLDEQIRIAFQRNFDLLEKLFQLLLSMELYIEKTSDGFQMETFQNTTEDPSVDVVGKNSTLRLTSNSLTFSVLPDGSLQIKLKPTSN